MFDRLYRYPLYVMLATPPSALVHLREGKVAKHKGDDGHETKKIVDGGRDERPRLCVVDHTLHDVTDAHVPINWIALCDRSGAAPQK